MDGRNPFRTTYAALVSDSIPLQMPTNVVVSTPVSFRAAISELQFQPSAVLCCDRCMTSFALVKLLEREPRRLLS